MRQATLSLFNSISPEAFCLQAHPDFSPMGWHLGHIGWTEGLWLLPTATRTALTPPEYNQLFAADGLPKQQRAQLPAFGEICDYLQAIRNAVIDEFLSRKNLGEREWLGWWILQHEAQHGETIQIVHALQAATTAPSLIASNAPTPMLNIPAGPLLPPTNSFLLLDNEKTSQCLELSGFEIDAHPVTRSQFHYFIESGGYETERWWTTEGWAWQQKNQIKHPRYWHWPLSSDHPVYGVSWYEAAAYAQFLGKQLPTEAQWQRANQILQAPPAHSIISTPRPLIPPAIQPHAANFGLVWEWTSSWFQPYPGFCSSPYPGYSAAYFDQAHRVLKGGSFASQPLTQRPSFRNWYQPQTQVIFAGIRCVQT